jgi:hypothetical protein
MPQAATINSGSPRINIQRGKNAATQPHLVISHNPARRTEYKYTSRVYGYPTCLLNTTTLSWKQSCAPHRLSPHRGTAATTMGLDLFSPVAPVRLNILLLPVGRIKRSRFLSFAARLQAEKFIRLGDISPDERPNRSTVPQSPCQKSTS